MNPSIAEIPPSLIRSISARKQPGDIDLGLGEPTLPPDLAPFQAALEWTRRNGSPYSPNAGFGELRAAIASYLGATAAGSAFAADQVCVTVGSEEALYLAIKSAVDPATDEVLIVEPCYLAYPKLCMLEGVRHRMVGFAAEEAFAPRAATVLEAIGPATRLIILNTPCNPTGRVWPEAELRALAAGLAGLDRPVFVLADEVYRELRFGGADPPSIAALHPNALVAGSLSKSNSLTGLRLGWLAGPAPVIAAATKVHQFVNTAASTFSQRVALALFEQPGSVASTRPHYASVRSVLLDACRDAGLHLAPPEGAFYGFIRLPDAWGRNSLGFAERLLERWRVVAVPGRAFGESGEGWLRISWVAPPELLRTGIERIGEAVRSSDPRA